MPPLPAVPNVVRLDFHQGFSSGSIVLNRMFVQFDGTGPSDTESVAFANAAMAAWGAHLKATIDPDLTLFSVTSTDLTSDVASVGESTSAAIVGTHAGSTSVGGLALCLSKHVARRYRGGHPRWYQGGITPDELVTPDAWEVAFLTSWEGLFKAMIDEIVGAGWTGGGTLIDVNVSYFHGFTVVDGPTGRPRAQSTLRAEPIVDPILSYHANPRPASQRRRNGQKV